MIGVTGIIPVIFNLSVDFTYLDVLRAKTPGKNKFPFALT